MRRGSRRGLDGPDFQGCAGDQPGIGEHHVVPALLRRFPTLRLAVPAEDIARRSGMLIHGVHRLPVSRR